ncbi:hypothetical protein H8L32_19325 [Undibacterium sp. CY18W]|uniref:Uncharacterized protein n=1 Tax=Undibacterium hunanense TaxID=2762292 RepID=A0ABR6ZUY0_9BURK|nr:hypothetical protein [Undibacterium hunanense]MBC3919645.1 hypothetical protein [Undibacterium hunanense]
MLNLVRRTVLGDVILGRIYFNAMNSSLEVLAMGTHVVVTPNLPQRGR